MRGYQSLMLVTSGRFPLGINFKFIFIHLNGGFLNQLYFCNFLEEKIYHPFSKLCIPIVPSCHLNFFICSDWCSTKREHREHIMCHGHLREVKSKTVRPKCGFGYL